LKKHVREINLAICSVPASEIETISRSGAAFLFTNWCDDMSRWYATGTRSCLEQKEVPGATRFCAVSDIYLTRDAAVIICSNQDGAELVRPLRRKCGDGYSNGSHGGSGSFGAAGHICFDLDELVAMLGATHLGKTELELKS